MNIISDEFIKNNINYNELIDALKLAFRNNVIQCPPKSAYDYTSHISEKKNTFLFMPSWDNQDYFGVKLIATTPHNSTLNDLDKPYVNGLYNLFDARTGRPLAIMGAKTITNIRTAATSVLASTYLAKQDASSVLIIGNGNISPSYIKAYATMISLNTIYLWGRNYQKTKQVTDRFRETSLAVNAIEDFTSVIRDVDIVSCITSSYEPIVLKEHLAAGHHFDLAGSFTEDMQEVSSELVANCSVYADNLDITLEHAGELVKAVKETKFELSDIKGDLTFLCQDDLSKRQTPEETTLFKSTGMAIEDLVMAVLIYEKYEKARNVGKDGN